MHKDTDSPPSLLQQVLLYQFHIGVCVLQVCVNMYIIEQFQPLRLFLSQA